MTAPAATACGPTATCAAYGDGVRPYGDVRGPDELPAHALLREAADR